MTLLTGDELREGLKLTSLKRVPVTPIMLKKMENRINESVARVMGVSFDPRQGPFYATYIEVAKTALRKLDPNHKGLSYTHPCSVCHAIILIGRKHESI